MADAPQSDVAAARLRRWLSDEAAALGFDVCAIAEATADAQADARLTQWLAGGAHGDMDWMAHTKARRANPRTLWPAAQSIIMLGVNYGPREDPLEVLRHKSAGAISVYARHRDYHDVVKGKLKQLASGLARQTKAQVKVFCDTAPVMEKLLAARAGLGWQGKHTNLVSRDFGSWLFLGSIFTDARLPVDAPERDHCGACRACLDICPTKAFPAPYQLDARRCISYLTIEHKGAIPEEFRRAIGNRIYGCDDCLAVCPWNKFASQAREAKLTARADLAAPPLAQLAGLDDAGFRALFAGGPIKRIGHARFLRNVLIAIGNSGDASLVASAEPHLAHANPMVRAMAIWALTQLCSAAQFADFARRFGGHETDADVIEEWRKGAQ